ncbi:MAG: hypothetical protein FWF31_12380 [Desulfobulbus sp.]|nr:hypothetical protein [Desulfobulbus sp.]
MKRRLQILPARNLAPNITNHPAQIGLQPLDLPIGPAHLPGVSMPARFQQSLGAKALSALTKTNPLLHSQSRQPLTAPVVQTRISRIRYRLLMNRGINDSAPSSTASLATPTVTVSFKINSAPSFPIRFRQPPQGRRIDRKSMPEMLLAAEILMVRIFHPPPNRLLIRGVEGMGQARQAHHHADRDAGTAFLRIQLAEFPLKRVPANQSAQPVQGVTMVQNVCQAACGTCPTEGLLSASLAASKIR